MSRHVTIDGVERMLLEAGFTKLRQRGSHQTFGHEDGRRVTVPHRANGCDNRRMQQNLLANVRKVLSGGRVKRAGFG